MGQEIERKFLVTGDGWRGHARGVRFRQGFLSTEPERVVRVRVAGTQGLLTIKGHPGVSGVTSIRPDGNAVKRPFLLSVREGEIVSLD